MKKVLFALGCLIVGLSLTACGGGGNSAELEQLRAENELLRDQLNGKFENADLIVETNNPYGEYQFSDAVGTQWTLTYNQDKSIILKNGKKEYYGSEESSSNNIYTIDFDLAPDRCPKIVFPIKGEEWEIITDNHWMELDLDNHYLYANRSSKTKDPKKRLEIKKVK